MTNLTLFLGTQRGYEVLRALYHDGAKIQSVLVLKQKPHELSDFSNQIIKFCKENKIFYKTTDAIKPSGYKGFLSQRKSDIVFVVSWRYLIPDECFDIPKYGIFIVHDSLLPRYRGFSPTNWVIINGEKETGLTLQYIDERMDAGDIVDQIKVKIDEDETATSLNNKLVPLYPNIIIKNYKKILNKKNKRVKQNEKTATYGAKRIPDDGKLNLNDSTDKLIRLIRGLSYPYPGAFCLYEKSKIIIWEASSIENPPTFVGRIPGKVVVRGKDYIDVLTGDGILRITKIAKLEKPKLFLNPTRVIKSTGVNLK